MTAALRYNAGKAELSYLLDLPRALTELCRVFEYGAAKYSRGNYKLGGKPDEEYLDAALRHVFAARTAARDPESGCLHLAHAIWNLAALIELNVPDPHVHRPAAV